MSYSRFSEHVAYNGDNVVIEVVVNHWQTPSEFEKELTKKLDEAKASALDKQNQLYENLRREGFLDEEPIS
jgi:hypothetical protein